jgi:hypothetical protein
VKHVALAQIPGLMMVKDLLCLAELIVITSKVCTNLTRLLLFTSEETLREDMCSVVQWCGECISCNYSDQRVTIIWVVLDMNMIIWSDSASENLSKQPTS